MIRNINTSVSRYSRAGGDLALDKIDSVQKIRINFVPQLSHLVSRNDGNFETSESLIQFFANK